MSHFLFIRNEPTIPSTLREVFSAPENRIVVRQSILDVESAIVRGAFDAIVIYSESGSDALQRTVREVREMSPDLFTVVLAPQYDLNEEQGAFDNGADLYFSEPIPTRTLRRVLSRGSDTPSPQFERTHEPPERERTAAINNTTSTLHVLRDLSHILSFSLDYKAFTQHFILKLRDHISFSRMGIFLESSAKQSLVNKDAGSRQLSCIASLGLPTDLVDCFQLSRELGIGRELSEQPRILRKSHNTRAPFPNGSSAIEKEFSILGCELAIPITDREKLIGLAVLNGPVTGRDYSDDELELLYLLMEELGLAIRNSRLHSELAQHGQLIENVMHSMASGAVVFSEDLDILYINDAAKRFLGIQRGDSKRPIEFAELPPKVAAPVHRAVEKGDLPEPFKIPGEKQDQSYQVSIFPFTQKGELVLLPRPTMIIIEDFTKIDANQRTALADSKSELISLIAERFAHEIRNSLVPLSTHAQLIDKKIEQPKFQASLKSAMLKETARIKRFSEQMMYLAQSSLTTDAELQLDQLVKSAFERACQHTGSENAQLSLNDSTNRALLAGNAEAITYALEEIFINSFQAEPGEQTIRADIQQNNEGILCLRLRDGGSGLDQSVIDEAIEPFYTTRNTGVGLGLSVANKIVSEHHGFLRLNARSEQRDWDIEIELPSLLTTI